MSTISLKIPHKAAQAPEMPSNVSFGMCVAILLVLLAILSLANGIAPTADPVIFPAP